MLASFIFLVALKALRQICTLSQESNSRGSNFWLFCLPPGTAAEVTLPCCGPLHSTV